MKLLQPFERFSSCLGRMLITFAVKVIETCAFHCRTEDNRLRKTMGDLNRR